MDKVVAVLDKWTAFSGTGLVGSIFGFVTKVFDFLTKFADLYKAVK